MHTSIKSPVQTPHKISPLLKYNSTYNYRHIWMCNRGACAIDEDHPIAAIRNELIWHALYFYYHASNNNCAILEVF